MKTVHAADAVIVQDGKVLLVQQRKPSAYGLWSCPGGHIEPGETPEQAVLREIREELGTDLLALQPLDVYEILSNEDGHTIVIHSFTGRLAGEIQLNTDELLAYKWFSMDELLTAAHALRTPVVLDQARAAIASHTNGI